VVLATTLLPVLSPGLAPAQEGPPRESPTVEEAGAVEVELPDGPDFKAVLDLSGASSPTISPDGSAVAYIVHSTDWDDDRYDREIWLARTGQEPFQLTRTEGESSHSPAWSPGGRRIAFLAKRGEATQIHLIGATGGEALALTAVEDGVSGFRWSPDGKQMAVAITDPRDKQRKKVEEAYGEFAVEDEEFQMTHLWVLGLEAALADDGGATLPEADEDDEESDGKRIDGASEDEEKGGEETDADLDEADEDDKPSPFRRLTKGDSFTVNTFRWSPDGSEIAFDHTPDPRVESFSKADISIVDVESGAVRLLVDWPGPDSDPYWSPDGRWIAFETANRQTAYYKNRELARVLAGGGEPVVMTESFDQSANAVSWEAEGLYFTAIEGTHLRLFRLDPESAAVTSVEGLPRFVWSIDFADDGRTAAIHGEGPDTVDEIYRFAAGTGATSSVTDLTEQTADWQVGNREVIQWTSRDGATIEGVLLTPDGFDRSQKHPLLVIIHGGPAWISYPARAYTYVYPVQQWLSKGAVILMPNYRGSTGYGEDFRALNVRNLGVGDSWDVLSGVDHLVDEGFIDSERMGAMGWSQGGYISAFLTTTSDRFKAISVGAGISNWMTYYVNTDIHPFTRHYLEATPWSDPEVYAKTSPMTFINDAVTPTLIQHGEFDRRVPVPNAYELFQGLQDVGVETRLVIYKGFGHGITKPKERLAAVWHNWQWFARHVWGEDVKMPVEQ
jgi:dipeptidyl aminopeptidase/acylaminoacyl peptidase